MPVTILVGLLVGMAWEYAAHRWLMHRPESGGYFLRHAVEHHREERSEYHHLHLTWPTVVLVWLLSGVVWLPLCLLTPWAPAVFVGLLLWWRVVWSQCHLLSHGLGGSWPVTLALCPWAGAVVRHHVRHHERPARNFGAVFFWTDRLMGSHTGAV